METKVNAKHIPAQVDDILTRGVGTFVDPEGRFRKNLIAKAMGEYKKDLIVKFGVDPTRPDIHLGHAVILRKLRQMQDLGVKVIFLIGDFTAQIGDPTGKSKVRPELEQAAIEVNVKTYLDQVGKILKLDESVFSWIRNSDWFYSVTDISVDPSAKVTWNVIDQEGVERVIPMNDPNSFVSKALLFDKTRMQTSVLKKSARGVTFATILSILRQITMAQLIERDMFQERLNSKEPLFMHEMLYPVMQGIDSSVIHDIYGSCDLEVGGTDQTFNLLMGRTVMEVAKKPSQAVLSFDLLVGLDGKEKMSKSLDNYVGITDAPNDMFGKLMSIPDAALPKYFELCTYTPMSEVGEIAKKLTSGKAHPKEVKMDLAKQIVDIYHGNGAGEHARENFVNTFQKKEVPTDIPKVVVKKGTLLVDALLTESVVESKTAFRRLLDDGAIRKDGEEKLSDPQTVIEGPLVLKVGKHRFVSFDVE